MDDLYLDTILDRYRHPQHKGWIDAAPSQHSLEVHKTHNPSCGDSFEIAFLILGNEIVDAKWRGEGCAISTTSTDFFCEWAIGKSAAQIKSFDQEKIRELTGIETITPEREKCLYLPTALTVSI